MLRDYPSLHSPAIPSQTRSEKNMPERPLVRTLPFYSESDLADTVKTTLDIMSDKSQGLGKRARGCLVESVVGIGYTGTLNAQVHDGNDWGEVVPIRLGAHINYKYEDYVFVELVKLEASGGNVHYIVHAVPGIPEKWELEEMGIAPEEGNSDGL